MKLALLRQALPASRFPLPASRFPAPGDVSSLWEARAELPGAGAVQAAWIAFLKPRFPAGRLFQGWVLPWLRSVLMTISP